MNDSALIRARAGDHQAFAALTDPNRRELQLHCYRILGQQRDDRFHIAALECVREPRHELVFSG